MSRDLTALADAYARDGVVRVPGLIDPAAVAALIQAVEMVRLTDQPKAIWPHAVVNRAPGRVTMSWLWRDRADIRAFADLPGVAATIAAILRSQQVRFWFDNTFMHFPGADAAGSPWHNDASAFPFRGAMNPSVWVALTDVPLDLAPLQCIAGSHRDRPLYRPPVYVDRTAPLPPGFQEMPDVAAGIAAGQLQVLQWPMQAGDALIVDPYTLHGAPPIRGGDRHRIAFTTRWLGDDVVWAPGPFSMKVPGIETDTVELGARPTGDLFPAIKF